MPLEEKIVILLKEGIFSFSSFSSAGTIISVNILSSAGIFKLGDEIKTKAKRYEPAITFTIQLELCSITLQQKVCELVKVYITRTIKIRL